QVERLGEESHLLFGIDVVYGLAVLRDQLGLVRPFLAPRGRWYGRGSLCGGRGHAAPLRAAYQGRDEFTGPGPTAVDQSCYTCAPRPEDNDAVPDFPPPIAPPPRLALPEGGWGSSATHAIHFEPTCLAVLALAGDDQHRSLIDKALAALDTQADATGLYRLERGRPQAIWPTAL